MAARAFPAAVYVEVGAGEPPATYCPGCAAAAEIHPAAMTLADPEGPPEYVRCDSCGAKIRIGADL